MELATNSKMLGWKARRSRQLSSEKVWTELGWRTRRRLKCRMKRSEHQEWEAVQAEETQQVAPGLSRLSGSGVEELDVGTGMLAEKAHL